MSTIYNGSNDWDWDELCPSKRTIKIVGCVILVGALLSFILPIHISIESGSSQKSPPAKTFTADEVAKLTEEAVQKEREKLRQDSHSHRYSDPDEKDDGLALTPAKTDEMTCNVNKEPGVEARKDIACVKAAERRR